MKRLCHDFNFLIFWLHHYYWPWNCKIWTNQRALGALLMCPLLVGDNNNCQLDSRTGRSGWKWCLIPTKSLPKDVLSALPNNKLLWGGWFSVLPDQLSSRDTALEILTRLRGWENFPSTSSSKLHAKVTKQVKI